MQLRPSSCVVFSKQEAMFDVKDFVSKPTAGAVQGILKRDWIALANYYDLELSARMRKAELQELVTEYLVEKQILNGEEVEEIVVTDNSALKVARFQVERERLKLEREREVARALQEEIRAAELKRLVVSITDDTKNLIPVFDELYSDEFFRQFEKNAVLHQWSKDRWTLLNQYLLYRPSTESACRLVCG